MEKIYGVYSNLSKRYCWYIQANSLWEAYRRLQKKIWKDAHKDKRNIHQVDKVPDTHSLYFASSWKIKYSEKRVTETWNRRNYNEDDDVRSQM